MKRSCSAVIIVAAALLVVSPVQGKEKKKKDKPAEPAKAEQPVVPRTEAGWTEVTTNAPKLVKVTYKLDGSSILIKFQNLSADKSLRIKYNAKWKKDWNGRLVDDSTADGLSVRLKKGENFTREVRTGAKGVKDVGITIDAAELS